MNGSAVAWAMVVTPFVLAFIPAVIADRKGRSFLRWWFFGLALIVALPAALLLVRDDPMGRARLSAWAIPVGIGLVPIGFALALGGVGGSWEGSSSWQACQGGDEFACWSPQAAGIQGIAAVIGGPALAGAAVANTVRRRRRLPPGVVMQGG